MNPLEWLALRLTDYGPWAPVLFVAAYVAASVAFIPGSLLTLVAGAVFGLGRGIPIVFVGAVLGSSAAFGIARTVGRSAVSRRLARHARADAVARAIGGQGARVVLLLRLSPVVPYNLLNYACGLSPIRYRDFLIASVGMLPGTVLYTYYGKVVGDVAALAVGTAPPRGPAYYTLLAVGLAATVAVMVLITRAARSALGQRLDR